MHRRVKKLLHHYFVPHHGNNFRAKLLHNSTLAIIAALMLFVGFSSVSVHRSHPQVLGIAYQVNINDLWNITNLDRSENGLPPLHLSKRLTQAAQEKAADMFAKNYWAHFAPDGSTTPWMFIKDSGYQYVYAGENLAKGYTTSDSVVQAWMNSPSHRENMLSKNYTDVGFAVEPGHLQGEDTVLVVEMFGSTTAPGLAPSGPSQQAVLPQQAAPHVQAAVPGTQQVTPVITLQPIQPVQTSHSQLENPGASYTIKPIFNAASISLDSTTVIFSILILAFLIDIIVIERRRIPRFVGHNLDHIFLLSLFLIVIFISHFGAIL